MKGKDHLRDVSTDGKITLKGILKNPIHILTFYATGCGWDSTGSMATFLNTVINHMGSIQCREFLERLSDHQLLKELRSIVLVT